ncbi:MAG: hypothetical protein ABR584_10155 [Candidatus Baltobacteraceae bacterium]
MLSHDLSNFLPELEAVYAKLSGEATFASTEPGFIVMVKALKAGRIEMVVEITPDHINEQHRFQSEIDQSYLIAPIAALKAILATYSPRGKRAAQ